MASIAGFRELSRMIRVCLHVNVYSSVLSINLYLNTNNCIFVFLFIFIKFLAKLNIFLWFGAVYIYGFMNYLIMLFYELSDYIPHMI